MKLIRSSLIIMLFAIVFSVKADDSQNYILAKNTCTCFYSDSISINDVFNNCTKKYGPQTEEIIRELMLYCEAYSYFFDQYRYQKLITWDSNIALAKLKKTPINLTIVYPEDTLKQHVQLLIAAFKMQEALKFIKQGLDQKYSAVWLYLYEGLIYEYWEDFEYARICYEKYQKIVGETAFSWQLIYFTDFLEQEYEDDND